MTARHQAPEHVQRRALGAIVNEALLVLEDGIAQRASDIGLVLVHGYGYPRHLGGPLYWAARQSDVVLQRAIDDALSAGGRYTRRGDLRYLD